MKLTIKIFILLIFVFALLLPVSTQAQTRSIANVTACSAGGLVANAISDPLNNLIGRGLEQVSRRIEGAIAGFLGLSGILGGAVPTDDSNMQLKYMNKEARADVITRCLAREIQNKMIGNILNVVRNHGRDGGATFIKNWRNFVTGGQYRGENIFRAVLSNAKICDHFNQGLKSTFRATTPTNLRSQNTRSGDFDPYALKANCSMPAGWSMDNYQKDFSGNGGWLAFATLTKPENNILGSFNLAKQEADKQRYLEEQIDLVEAQVSGGFTSRRGRGASDSCLLNAQNGQCMVYKDILTPGSVLQNSVASTVQQEIAWITDVDEMGEIVSALIGSLLNRILDLGHNDENRAVDPADLPIYNPIAPGTGVDDLQPPGQQGPIDYDQNPCDPNDPDCVPPLEGGSASIFGYVFEDSNEDGNRDSDEPLRSGDIVLLQTEDGSETLRTNQTFQGIYTFGQLEDGQNYRVTLQVPSGYTRTTDDSTVVTASDGGTGRDFGIKSE